MLVDLRGLADRVEAEAIRARANEIDGIMHDAHMAVSILAALVQTEVENIEGLGHRDYTDDGLIFTVTIPKASVQRLEWAARHASDILAQARSEFDGLLKAH